MSARETWYKNILHCHKTHRSKLKKLSKPLKFKVNSFKLLLPILANNVINYNKVP